MKKKIINPKTNKPLITSSNLFPVVGIGASAGGLDAFKKLIRAIPEKELEQTREDMRAITEDQEAVNEELQSANEELLSGSEELQSLNEELETSQEELQSTNEELIVVNQEMTGLNEQVTAARDYADAIIATIREPLLVLDKNLLIKTANKNFYKTFQVNEQETVGKLIYNLGNKQWNIPALRELLEKIIPEKESFFDFEVTHNFVFIGERTMLLNAREIISESESEKLILLAIEDITVKKTADEKIKESEKQFSQLADFMPQKVWKADADGNLNYFNQNWLDFTGLTFENLKGWGWKKIIHPDDWEENKKQWQHSINTGNDFEFEHRFLNQQGEYQWHLSRGLAYKDENGKIKMWIGSNTEIQHQKEQREELEKTIESRTQQLEQKNVELESVNNEFTFQNEEKEKRAAELIIANKELAFQSEAKEKRAAELIIANKELAFQNEEKEKRAAELIIANKVLHQKNKEIALSKYNKRFLTEFSEKFSAYKLHNEFFSSLVQYISDLTHLDYVFVGKIEQAGNNEFAIQTFAITAFGKLTENIHYALPDGPCEQVIQGTVYSYPQHCRQTFPKNEVIAQFNVEGYIGYPLYDEQGNAVGLIAVMHEKEIEDPETVSSILKIVAKRAEIELERIKYEEKLEQTNKTLEDKNQELAKMNYELESFSYVSSHDLQEPLRKIQTFAGRILEKDNQNLSNTGKDDFRRMREAANRMQALIHDLLAFSHLNTTERKFENTDLTLIIEEVKNNLKETIVEKNATIEATELCKVSIIPFQFRQLMNNLIGNALKFSTPGTPPHITIKSKISKGSRLNNEQPSLPADKLSPEKEYCHITVSDNGIGFEPKFKDKIFEIFQRLHSRYDYAGTGIGLSIVKKIVENHNGIITATSELEKGAKFDIYIPTKG